MNTIFLFCLALSGLSSTGCATPEQGQSSAEAPVEIVGASGTGSADFKLWGNPVRVEISTETGPDGPCTRVSVAAGLVRLEQALHGCEPPRPEPDADASSDADADAAK